MTPKSQAINPLLQREIAQHQPSTSITAILRLLSLAEAGYLQAQAELFADMEERDAHIYAEMTKRKMAVAQLDWALKPNRSAGAREKRAVLDLEERIKDTFDIETLVFDLASAIGHGFMALELQWGRDASGFWMPKTFNPRPQRWFTVDQATRQQLRLRDNQSIDGVELVKYGWIVHEHSSKTTGEVGTQGLYRALALPYLFKNFATKNWLRFCELYAVPIRVFFHHEKDEAKKYALLDALQAMGQNGVALLEGGTQDDLKTVDSATGEGQGFLNLIQWCEASVSKAILGGTLTSDTGRNGNYATAAVHDEVRNELRDHDAKQIAETLTNQLIGAISAVNGLNFTCRWGFDTQQSADLALYADAIPKLVTAGFKIPASYVYDKLKIPLPEAGEEVVGVGTGRDLSVPDLSVQTVPPAVKMSALVGTGLDLSLHPQFTLQQQVIEDLADSLLNAQGSPINSDLIASAIRAATDPEDLEERLAAIMVDADMTEFSDVLAKCLFTADVLGYVHAG